MLVDGRPFIIKGITYAPTKVGQSPDKGTLVNWMMEDSNHNGILDGPYESWVDANHNNKQDSNEPTVGDFQLMKEMGVNMIRFYHQPFEPKKDVLRAMYDKYGIMVALGVTIDGEKIIIGVEQIHSENARAIIQWLDNLI